MNPCLCHWIIISTATSKHHQVPASLINFHFIWFHPLSRVCPVCSKCVSFRVFPGWKSVWCKQWKGRKRDAKQKVKTNLLFMANGVERDSTLMDEFQKLWKRQKQSFSVKEFYPVLTAFLCPLSFKGTLKALQVEVCGNIHTSTWHCIWKVSLKYLSAVFWVWKCSSFFLSFFSYMKVSSCNVNCQLVIGIWSMNLSFVIKREIKAVERLLKIVDKHEKT